MGNVEVKRAGATPFLDSATVLLAAAGIVIAFSQHPEPRVEMGRVVLFYAGLMTILILFRDRRAARRSGATRVFAPTARRFAGGGAIIVAAAALGSFLADSTGSGWLGVGFFLCGAVLAVQCLVALRAR